MSKHNENTDKPTPYKGLRSYEEDDAPFFFGREKYRKIITDNLLASRLTILYGTSGVGKTSVLQAGVARHLRDLARQNLKELGAPNLAVIVFNCWRDDPLLGLIQKVEDAIKDIFEGQPIKPKPVQIPSRLDQVLRAWTRRIAGKQKEGELFIILDQFEEYFLYHPREDGEGTFAVEFPRAINSPDLHVNFLISIRDDSLVKIDRFKGRIPKLMSNRLRIVNLDEESATNAILKPVREYNYRQETDQAPIGVEPNLVKAVLDQVKIGHVSLDEMGLGSIASKSKTPTVNQIETPYLQLVMTRLWQKEMNSGSRRLRLETLNKLGGAKQIVKKHLDSRMNDLPPQVQDTAANIFTYLVTPSGSKIAHTVDDLVKYLAEKQSKSPIRPERQQIQSLLEKLSNADFRILRPVGLSPSNPEAGERYEIFHDVLATAILTWRKRILAQRRLEAEHKKRKAITYAIASVAILFIGTLGWQYLSEKKEAEDTKILLAAKTMVQEVYKFDMKRKEEASKILGLESECIKAWRKYEEGQQLKALILAMQIVGEAKDAGLMEKAPVPKWMLQRILAEIRETNHFTIKIPPEIFISSADFSVETQKLATASRDGTVYLWNLKGEKLAEFKGGEDWSTSISFSPDGQTVATNSIGGAVRLWDAEGKLKAAFTGNGTWSTVSFSHDGKSLLKSLDDGTVCLWNLKGQLTNELFKEGQKDGKNWFAISMSPDGESIALAARDGTIQVRELNGKRRAEFQGPKSWVTKIIFSPDGGKLATASMDGTVRLWNLEGREEDRFIHSNAVSSVKFSADNRQLVSITRNGTVHYWKLKKSHGLKVTQEKIVRVSFSPDGQKLATASRDGVVYLWNLKGEKLAEFNGGEGWRTDVSFSPDGKMLATASTDGTIRLWNSKGQKEAEFTGEGAWGKVSFSPDGKMLAAASRDGTVYLWNLKGEKLTEFRGGEGRGTFISFSPDGKSLARASRDGIVYLWNLKGEKLAEFRGGEGWGTFVSFSPDGLKLATTSSEGIVRLWTLNGERLAEFKAHRSWVTRVIFSPDGRMLATASADNNVSIWNLNFERLEKFQNYTGLVRDLSFINEGKLLASASIDGNIQIWSIPQLSRREKEDVLARGCKYLSDYLESHPSEKKVLSICNIN